MSALKQKGLSRTRSKRSVVLILLIAVVFIFTGCGEIDGIIGGGDGAKRISDAGVLTTQSLGIKMDDPTTEPKKETIPSVGNGPTATCTTTGWGKEEVRKLTDTVGLNLSGATIYPGALIRGKNFKDGNFTAITIPRSGGTISMSGVKLAPNAIYKKDIDEITRANVKQAIEDILSDEVQGTAANASYQEETTYDYNHLTFELGIDARYGLGTMESDLKIDKSKTKNYVFSKFTQVYYDVTYQDPELSTSVFRDGANFSDPEGQIGAENPPLYVSKVSYGRMVFFVAESEHESTEVEAALKAAVRGGAGSGKVDSGLTYDQVMARTKVNYYVIGGDAGLALSPIDSATPGEMFQKVKEFIAGSNDGENGRTAAVYSASSPGVPIAYTLNYLSDRTPARMSYSVSYDQKDCTFAYPEQPAKLKVEVTFDTIYASQRCDTFTATNNYRGKIGAVGSTRTYNKDLDHESSSGVGQKFTKTYTDPTATQQFWVWASYKEADSGLEGSDDILGPVTKYHDIKPGTGTGSLNLSGDGCGVRFDYSYRITDVTP